MSDTLLVKLVDGIIKGNSSTSTLNNAVDFHVRELNRSIERVEDQLTRTIEAHFKQASDHLRYAQQTTNSANRRTYLEKAKDSFLYASHVTDCRFGAASAKLMVATCFHLLGERKNALDASEEAYNIADRKRIELNNSMNSLLGILSYGSSYQKREEVHRFMIEVSKIIAKLEGTRTYYVEVEGKRQRLKPVCPGCGWKTIISQQYCPLCREELMN